MKLAKVERIIGLVALIAVFTLAFSPSQSGAIEKSAQDEYWYGALIVTAAQGIELLDNPQWFPGCRVVALVSFNFDDGYSSVYDHALPIFQRYEIPASVFTVTGKVGTLGYVTVEQLEELVQNDWEIGSQTVTQRRLTELSPSEVQNELVHSKETLEAWGFGVTGFVSPEGKYNEMILEQIKRYYDYHRTAWPGINSLPLLGEGHGSRWELYYIEVKNETLPGEVMAEIVQISQQGGWIIIGFHNIGTDDWRWTYPAEALERIIRFTREDLGLCTLEEFRRGDCQPR